MNKNNNINNNGMIILLNPVIKTSNYLFIGCVGLGKKAITTKTPTIRKYSF